MGSAVTYSDMPKAQNARDLSDYMARLDSAVTALLHAKQSAFVRMQEISKAIDAMEDAEERQILQRRYIQDESWEQIAYELHWSWRHTLRRHGNALQHFEPTL